MNESAVVTSREPERTVLYIEDNVANARLVERILAMQSQVRVVITPDGRHALELARQLVPQLILLDIHLPDINGDEVLRALRSDPRTASVPVVIVSADATPATVDRFMAAGAQDFLIKPLDLERLVEVVETQSRTASGSSQRTRNDDTEVHRHLNERALSLLRRLRDEGPAGEANTLVRLFITESARDVVRLRDAVMRKDAVAVANLAHTLNGLTGSYGSRLIPELCRRLEVLAESGSITGTQDLLREIESELERVHTSLQHDFAHPKRAEERGER